MKPNRAVEASEYVSDILLELEGFGSERDVNPEFSDTVPGRKEHIIEGSRKLLEVYGEAVDRPVHDSEGNIRFEYAMGTIYAGLGSYNGDWDFNGDEVESLHNAYRYLFLKSDLSGEEVGYDPARYSDVQDTEEHEEAFLQILEGFWQNRDYLAQTLER